MKVKIKALTILGSLVLMAFVVNVGTASADGRPGQYVGDAEEDGINTAAVAGAFAPIGGGIIFPGPDAGSANGVINGFNGSFDEDGLFTPDPLNSAVIGVTHNPLCPLNEGNQHH